MRIVAEVTIQPRHCHRHYLSVLHWRDRGWTVGARATRGNCNGIHADLEGIRAFHDAVHLLEDTLLVATAGVMTTRSPSSHVLSPVFYSRPPSEVLGLMCSVPLLENLTFPTFGRKDEDEEWTTPLIAPGLTGCLELCSMVEGISSIAHRLLDLPNGLDVSASRISVRQLTWCRGTFRRPRISRLCFPHIRDPIDTSSSHA